MTQRDAIERQERPLDAASAASLWCAHPLFGEAGAEVCERLAEKFAAYPMRDGDALLRAGEVLEGVLVVLGGRVAAHRRHVDEREVLSRIVEGPALFGDVELLHGLPALHDLEALDDGWYALLSEQAFRALLAQHPACARAYEQHLAALACLAARSEALIFASLEQRIASVVLAYAQHFGRPAQSGGLLVDRPLSLKTLARSVGGVWRSVGHALGGLRSKGLVSKQGELLVIEDPAALRELALPDLGGISYSVGMSLAAERPRRRPPSGEIKIAKGPEYYEGQQVLVEDELLIGRAPPVDLVIPDASVCPRHCRVFRSPTGGRFWVQDLDSHSGTRVNGAPVRRAVLRDGDRITVGGTEMVFRLARIEDEQQAQLSAEPA